MSLLRYPALRMSARSKVTGVEFFRSPFVATVSTSNGSTASPVLVFASLMHMSRSKKTVESVPIEATTKQSLRMTHRAREPSAFADATNAAAHASRAS